MARLERYIRKQALRARAAGLELEPGGHALGGNGGQVARYYGMVSQIDDAIGRILRHVDLRDTLVVFTSDHGDMCGNHRMLDKHCTLYQDIVRVPLILAGPGVEAQVNDNLVSNCLDLPVTLASLLGFARRKARTANRSLAPRAKRSLPRAMGSNSACSIPA